MLEDMLMNVSALPGGLDGAMKDERRGPANGLQ